MALFSSTLSQILFLFTLIIVGYILAKGRFVPDNSAAVLGKLENYVFIPALVMGTFIDNFTVDRIRSTWKILLFSFAVLAVFIPLAMLVSRLLTKDKYIRDIYTYGLSFSNFSFMGNAVVSALFPDIFFEYLLFTLPMWTMIYLWGAPALLIGSGEKHGIKDKLKSFVNPMFISMIIGMIIGLCPITLPSWMSSVISSASGCMSPVAMILSGMTVAQINFKKTFTDLQIYIVSLVRLVVFPLLFVAIAQFLPIDETLYICTLCSLAMPLGLNTVVIPSAYGKDTTAAAGMAMVSHLLSCITIPLIFMLI